MSSAIDPTKPSWPNPILRDLHNNFAAAKNEIEALQTNTAQLDSPAFTGTPTVPTATAGTNTTQAASTAFVVAADAVTLAASKSYADSLVVGLLDDRGSYDASGGTWPAAGGSGGGGIILKGDLWFISVAGTLGGQSCQIGTSIRALVDNPGQTAGNWDVISTTLGFTPENVANKITTWPSSPTDTQYPSAKLLTDTLNARVLHVDAIASLSATGLFDGQAIYAKGRSAAGDGGGGLFRYLTATTLTVDSGIVFAPSLGTGRFVRDGFVDGLGYGDVVNPRWFGAKLDGVTDDTAAINTAMSALAGLGATLKFTRCSVLLGSALTPVSTITLACDPSVTFIQKASAAISTTAGGYITKFKITGFPIFSLQKTSPKKWDKCFDLKAHNKCLLEAELVGYTNQIALFTKPDYVGSPAQNVYFNKYFLHADAIGVGIYEQGLQTNVTEAVGAGGVLTATSTFNVKWPVDLTVMICRESSGLPEKMLRGVDYTITSGAAGTPGPVTIQTTASIASGDVVTLWPSHPSSPKCPITDNLFTCHFLNVKRAYYVATCYSDASKHINGYSRLGNDNTAHVLLNPVSDTNQETDFWFCSGMTFGQVGTVDGNTVKILRAGPGSNRLVGHGIIADKDWSGNLFDPYDTSEINLTGTVTITSGNLVVVGVGTKFTEELNAAALADRIRTPDNFDLVIASVDSDTQVTLVDPPAISYSGAVMRYNQNNDVSGIFSSSQDGLGGAGRSCDIRIKAGDYMEFTGSILAGQTECFIRYTHRLNKTPEAKHIHVTATSPMGTRQWYVDPATITSKGFKIKVQVTNTVAMNFEGQIHY